MRNIKQILNGVVFTAILLFSFTAHALYLSGNDVYTLNGYDSFINTYDTSMLTMEDYSGSAHVNAYNQSTINVLTSGSISHFSTFNESTANIFDGNFSFINVLDNSQVNLYGLGSTSWFMLGLDAHLTVYGDNIMYQNGHVSGMGVNGYFFGFDVLKVDEFGGIIDGIATNVTISSVPEPMTLLLFLSGLIPLFAKVKLNGNRQS